MNRKNHSAAKAQGTKPIAPRHGNEIRPGATPMYGVPEFLVRIAGWRRLPAGLLEPLPGIGTTRILDP